MATKNILLAYVMVLSIHDAFWYIQSCFFFRNLLCFDCVAFYLSKHKRTQFEGIKQDVSIKVVLQSANQCKTREKKISKTFLKSFASVFIYFLLNTHSVLIFCIAVSALMLIIDS